MFFISSKIFCIICHKEIISPFYSNEREYCNKCNYCLSPGEKLKTHAEKQDRFNEEGNTKLDNFKPDPNKPTLHLDLDLSFLPKTQQESKPPSKTPEVKKVPKKTGLLRF